MTFLWDVSIFYLEETLCSRGPDVYYQRQVEVEVNFASTCLNIIVLCFFLSPVMFLCFFLSPVIGLYFFFSPVIMLCFFLSPVIRLCFFLSPDIGLCFFLSPIIGSVSSSLLLLDIFLSPGIGLYFFNELCVCSYLSEVFFVSTRENVCFIDISNWDRSYTFSATIL